MYNSYLDKHVLALFPGLHIILLRNKANYAQAEKKIFFFQIHRFVANARFGDGLIFQAEGSNKKEAKTMAADMALRKVSKSTVVQVRPNQTHEQ